MQVGDVRDAQRVLRSCRGSLRRRRGSLPARHRLAPQVVREQQVGRHRHVAAQRRAHREEVARGGDVVHAQHVRAVVEAVRDRGERAAEPLARARAR